MKASLARNTFVNFCGNLAPLGITLITVPLYLHQIGEARYGVLAMVWLLLGYFGLFDLGLARATANQVAKLHDSAPEERTEVFGTALYLNAAFGITGGLLLWATGALIFKNFFTAPSELKTEVIASLPWVAASVPLATVFGVLAGALEGRERFLQLNAMQLFGTALFQVIPLIIAYRYGPDLRLLIAAAVSARAVTCIALAVVAFASLPVRGPIRLVRERVGPLVAYGGWITITNFAAPILATADQFLVGSVLGAASVAWYTVPFNLAWRATILPAALMRAMFPRMSMLSREAAGDLSEKTVRAIGMGFAPMIGIGIALMDPFLRVWVGPDFASSAAPVGEIMLLGVWINSLAYGPYALLQAQGRPGIVAKLLILELAPFLALLWIAMKLFGLQGAAWAWTGRIAVDTGLFMLITRVPWHVVRLLIVSSMALAAEIIAARLARDHMLVSLGVELVAVLILTLWALRTEPQLRGLVMRMFLRRRTSIPASPAGPQ